MCQRFVIETRLLGSADRWSCLEQTFLRGEQVIARAAVRERFLKKQGPTVEPEDPRSSA